MEVTVVAARAKRAMKACTMHLICSTRFAALSRQETPPCFPFRTDSDTALRPHNAVSCVAALRVTATTGVPITDRRALSPHKR